MSQDFLIVPDEVKSLEAGCSAHGIPLIDGLLVAFGIPEEFLDAEQLKPIKFMFDVLVTAGELSPAEAASLITKSFDGILGPNQDMLESGDGEQDLSQSP